MIHSAYFLTEHFNSFIAEHASAYTTAGVPQSPSEYHQWTNEELSRIRRELRKLAAFRVLNAADAEDIVQDTLLTLIHSCPGECLEKGPLVWSMGVLRNKIGNYYRKGRYRAKREAGETEAREGMFQIKTTVSPEKELLHGELESVVADAVERLPGAQRTAIKMLIAGLKPGEIATKMSPERYQAVINHLHRGRKKIAQELARYGFGGMHEMKRSRSTKKQTQGKNGETESSQAM